MTPPTPQDIEKVKQLGKEIIECCRASGVFPFDDAHETVEALDHLYSLLAAYEAQQKEIELADKERTKWLQALEWYADIENYRNTTAASFGARARKALGRK